MQRVGTRLSCPPDTELPDRVNLSSAPACVVPGETQAKSPHLHTKQTLTESLGSDESVRLRREMTALMSLSGLRSSNRSRHPQVKRTTSRITEPGHTRSYWKGKQLHCALLEFLHYLLPSQHLLSLETPPINPANLSRNQVHLCFANSSRERFSHVSSHPLLWLWDYAKQSDWKTLLKWD